MQGVHEFLKLISLTAQTAIEVNAQAAKVLIPLTHTENATTIKWALTVILEG